MSLRATEKREKSIKGFSLIESLVSLSLFLLIVLFSLEFFGYTRNLFLQLKEQQEKKLAAFTALDKMRTDLRNGGAGCIDPIHLGLLEGITVNNGTLIILSRDKELSLPGDLVPGQTSIFVESTKTIKKGRELCIFDSTKGEVASISSVYPDSIVLSSPINNPYLKENASMILLKKISLYLDKDKHILRRKVNSSPAQPLLDEASFFDCDYDINTNLVKLRLRLNGKKEKDYEISVFPKNTALAVSQ